MYLVTSNDNNLNGYVTPETKAEELWIFHNFVWEAANVAEESVLELGTVLR